MIVLGYLPYTLLLVRTVLRHYLRWRMPPFMRQCWGLQVGPMHESVLRLLCAAEMFVSPLRSADDSVYVYLTWTVYKLPASATLDSPRCPCDVRVCFLLFSCSVNTKC